MLSQMPESSASSSSSASPSSASDTLTTLSSSPSKPAQLPHHSSPQYQYAEQDHFSMSSDSMRNSYWDNVSTKLERLCEITQKGRTFGLNEEEWAEGSKELNALHLLFYILQQPYLGATSQISSSSPTIKHEEDMVLDESTECLHLDRKDMQDGILTHSRKDNQGGNRKTGSSPSKGTGKKRTSSAECKKNSKMKRIEAVEGRERKEEWRISNRRQQEAAVLHTVIGMSPSVAPASRRHRARRQRNQYKKNEEVRENEKARSSESQ